MHAGSGLSARNYEILLHEQAGYSHTTMSTHTHLNPNIIKDSLADSAGIIAGELAAEDEGLISDQTLNSHSYGANLENGIAPTKSRSDVEFALPRKQLMLVISSLYMASFLAALDTTIVTTLLNVIASDLDGGENIGWIATAYLLSCLAFQPLYGKLSDIFGRKALLLNCCFFFAVGCCICATDSLFWLVVGRFVTGIGGSGLTTLGTITMSDLIPLRERGLYQGLANICFGLGAASGGVIGGIVSDLFGWKYAFLLQVPLATLVGVALHFCLVLPEDSPGNGAAGTEFKSKLKRVDYLGAFLLVSALMILLAAASMGGKEIAYKSKTFSFLLALAVLLIFAFVYVELRVSKEPIIPMEIMVDRTILSSSLANWFYTMGAFTYLFYIPLFFQAVMGLTATQSGERLVPNFFALSFGSVGAGLYMKKYGRYYALTVLTGVVSLAGMARILVFLSPQSSYFTQFTILILPGLGYACILTVTLLSLIAAVPVLYQACTTSIQYTFRATGSTLGVAVASAIFQKVVRDGLHSKVPSVVGNKKEALSIIKHALQNTDYAKSAPDSVRQIILDCYSAGCRGALWFSTLAIGLGFLTSLFIKEHKLHTSMSRS